MKIFNDYAAHPHLSNDLLLDFKNNVSKFGKIEINVSPNYSINIRPISRSGQIIYNDLADAKKAYNYFKTIDQRDLLITRITVILPYYDKDMPLLQFVGFKLTFINNGIKSLSDIFLKYLYVDNPFSKEAILDCQKELIEFGFVGNAHYGT